jgi:serine/threonine protein kinase
MTAGEGGGGLLENWMWMAPETWQSKQSYSLKADVWSTFSFVASFHRPYQSLSTGFAIILWELLAWRHPWDEYAFISSFFVK